MRCPWCGSGPVTIRGGRWECGWCGDFGTLRHIPELSPEPQPVKMTLAFSTIYHVDLPGTWKNMKAAVRTLAPRGDTALFPLLGKVLLYEISDGIRHRNSPPEPEKLQELEQFLKETPDLELDAPASVISQTIQSNILYPREAALSEEACGKFWRKLIFLLTPEQYYGDKPDGLFDLLHELSSAYSYFGDTNGEEFATEQELRFELNDAFYLHWQEKLLLHPDVVRAKQLLTKGEFPDHEDICRDILVTEFPEEAADYTLEELDDHGWDDILDDVFERDASKAIRMWRTLLDAASPRLRSDPETARQLLQDWSVLDPPTLNTAEAFLTALEDERFAGQVFQSANVGNLQQDLLTVCRNFDRIELGQHCLELVLKNPFLNGAWEQRLRKTMTPDVRSSKPQGMHIPSAGDIPDDGTVFHYCTVRLQGVRRAYSYLTGGLPLKVGDWVEVPFGKEEQPRCGQVGSLTDCTRLAAPWPPEQTKTVLRVVEAPIEPEKTLMFSVSAPMPSLEPEPEHQQEFRHSGVSKPVVTDTSPHIQESASSAENPEAERFVENSITENKQKMRYLHDL